MMVTLIFLIFKHLILQWTIRACHNLSATRSTWEELGSEGFFHVMQNNTINFKLLVNCECTDLIGWLYGLQKGFISPEIPSWWQLYLMASCWQLCTLLIGFKDGQKCPCLESQAAMAWSLCWLLVPRPAVGITCWISVSAWQAPPEFISSQIFDVCEAAWAGAVLSYNLEHTCLLLLGML